VTAIEINDLTTFGQINDIPAYQLPPEAWTLVENMRYTKDGVAVLEGWAQVFGTPGVAPHFALPVKSTSQSWWLYTSLTKAYVFDGVTHTNITRQTAGVDVNYTTNNTQDWNGTVFGGIPILNNGVDVPQYWASYSTATKLAALPNWPATQRAKIIRNFGSYLVAFNITDTGVTYPHLVGWSSPADPGSVPATWDYADPTNEAGRNPLPDVNSGEIKEAKMLQNTMFVYKERSIWKMTFIGGQFIFDFDLFLEEVGILGPRCVCNDEKGTRHIVVTQDDIIAHNGNSVESILTDRQRRNLFESLLNRETAETSFIFLNRLKDEVWFCFPEQGQTVPTRALIWNYKKGKGAISYASGITFRNAVVGDIEGAPIELWSTGTDVWDADTGPWSQFSRGRIVLCGTTATKFYQLDSGLLRDTVQFSPTLQRIDLGIIGRTRANAPINDWKKLKMVDSVAPKVTGAPIRVRVGFRDAVSEAAPLTWQDYTIFDPAVDIWVNTIVNENLPGCGRAVAIEFSADNSAAWRIDGYSMDVTVVGDY
jgi:hypothetical protein